MTRTIPVEVAAGQLAELVSSLQPGDEIALTTKTGQSARIIADFQKPKQRRQAGMGRGRLVILREDDDHVADFREYME